MAAPMIGFSKSIWFFVVFFYFMYCDCIQWPIPYKRFSGRPATKSYCQAQYPFCPTGRGNGSMPKMQDTDVIEIYALKAPVFEFVTGDLLAKFNIIHDAIGFKNTRTGLNYTMEWYELYEVFNCTFAHVLKNDSLLWCNQGAACIYNGIDDIHWSQNGTLVKVGEMSGLAFNQYAGWVQWDNNTGIYYETWTVEQEPGGKMWFDSYDCASFVLRAFPTMAKLGAKFNTNIHLNYTRIHLYSDEPQYLGNASTLFGPGGNKTLAADITNFYRDFQSHQSFLNLLKHLLHAAEELIIEKKFYLFYNFEYWYLPMKPPYVKLTYYEVPLPGAESRMSQRKVPKRV